MTNAAFVDQSLSKGMFHLGLDIKGLYTPQLGCSPGGPKLAVCASLPRRVFGFTVFSSVNPTRLCMEATRQTKETRT